MFPTLFYSSKTVIMAMGMKKTSITSGPLVGSGLRWVFLVFLLLGGGSLPRCSGEKVTVNVMGGRSIASTDDHFVCATLDWWPPTKCNYNQCPWGNTSIINLDLDNPILNNAVKAFDSLRIRLGGSLQDQVVYHVGNYTKSKCRNFERSDDGLFGFTEGCLSMNRWDKVNHFLNKNGIVATFGLNALLGRKNVTGDGLYTGDLDVSNTRDFMEYTVSKGYKIESWELGNELSGTGVAARVSPDQYGRDLIRMKQVIDNVYHNETSKPKLLAPGGFFDAKWFTQFLQTSGPYVVNGVTHHIYNLGPGDDMNLINKIQDPYYLSQITDTYRNVEQTVKKNGPWASAWIGESGGAFNSGGKTVSHTFANSFWYLDQLGMASTFDHKVFCRQALIGGNYALLNTTSLIPNPDYYGALLWNRLMGPQVLSATQSTSPYLRVYSHCSKNSTGITVLLINLSNSTHFEVKVSNDMNLNPTSANGTSSSPAAATREEYHLTPEGGNIQSDVVLLNGIPLRLNPKTKAIPAMNPTVLHASLPIHVRPHSIVYAHIKDFKAPPCG